MPASSIDRFNILKARYGKVNEEVSQLSGRVSVLKEQFAEKSKQLKQFGVSSIDELGTKTEELDAELQVAAKQFDELLDFYEGGNYQAIIDSETKQ